MTMVVFRDNLAHMVVNGRFLFKFQSAVRPFSKFTTITTMAVFMQNLTHVVVKWWSNGRDGRLTLSRQCIGKVLDPPVISSLLNLKSNINHTHSQIIIPGSNNNSGITISVCYIKNALLL